jgi:DNA-binding SARP family transcriptional activator
MPAKERHSEALLRRTEVDAVQAPARLRLALLGSFELFCGDGPVPVPVPAQRLLAFLALQDHPASRQYVAGTLWIDSSDERALGSLRSALWRLRRCAPALVESTDRGLRLGPAITVDIREASELARQLFDPATDVEGSEDEQTALASDLLPDWYDDWVVLERERFRQLRVHALESLCERLSARKIFARAVEAGLAAVRGEPLRESAHRTLIRVYLAEGNRAQAVLQYRFFRRLLNDQLGLEPTGEMEALVESLIRR